MFRKSPKIIRMIPISSFSILVLKPFEVTDMSSSMTIWHTVNGCVIYLLVFKIMLPTVSKSVTHISLCYFKFRIIGIQWDKKTGNLKESVKFDFRYFTWLNHSDQFTWKNPSSHWLSIFGFQLLLLLLTRVMIIKKGLQATDGAVGTIFLE